ncbi:Protein sly1 [Zancudomyces culisetae]|uniref:Protein sly1 n=1 Tax=Zancudomyces culisetae TaxID=1213189 RepID=A0A1R1PUP4_ZANCU|nr:Protein sly1 [Zancudomyces culisetae]|eukprot:OMH84691.1 Protein sly1 [Zancudomyces culisetae]
MLLGRSDFGNSTRQLQKAVDSLPEMTARKAAIDMHMNVATALLEKIKERQLDIIFQLEENMNKQTRQTILDFLNDEGRGSLNDKLRVLMLYLLSRQGKGGNVGGMAGSSSGLDGLQASGKSQSVDSVAEAFEKAFLEKDIDLSALAYFKKLQAMNKIMLQNVVTSSPSVGGSDFLGKFSSIGSKLSAIKDGTGLASGLFAGVKGFLPQDKDLPITQLVKSIMERPGNIGTASASSSPMLGGGGIGGVGDNMIYLDPLSTSPPSFSLFPPADQGKFGHQQKSVISSFQNCIVFVIGGGNYLEYQNLQDYANESSPRKFIIYGSTDIVNPEGLLKQFSELNSLQS